MFAGHAESIYYLWHALFPVFYIHNRSSDGYSLCGLYFIFGLMTDYKISSTVNKFVIADNYFRFSCLCVLLYLPLYI